VDASRIASEPLLPEPVRRRTYSGPRAVREIRLPLGGPYRPRARLVRLPSGELRWLVRLWQIDRPVAQLLPTHVVRAFAERSGLPELLRAIDAALASAASEADRE
jgi:hypothetical protein